MGKTMAKTIEQCLSSWGLNHVLTLTVDNATSNDIAISLLKNRLTSSNSLIMNGDYVPMRSCAHILNMIIRDRLKDKMDYVCKIRVAVKYVRPSPSRLANCKKCVIKQVTDFKGLVCLDVETRWNSTYLMLDVALKHRKEFEEFEMEDMKYANELQNGVVFLYLKIGNLCVQSCHFLKLFYDVILHMSGSTYVTSNLCIFEAFGIGRTIKQMCTSKDASVKKMAEVMKKKYDKYWGVHDCLNMFLLIAHVLHPRYKLQFLHWLFIENFSREVASVFKKKVKSKMKYFFEEYDGGTNEFEANSQEVHLNKIASDDPYGFSQFFLTIGSSITELFT